TGRVLGVMMCGDGSALSFEESAEGSDDSLPVGQLSLEMTGHATAVAGFLATRLLAGHA
ncbi:hypothetical protein E4U61_007805, partial [Claviceps capensis]